MKTAAPIMLIWLTVCLALLELLAKLQLILTDSAKVLSILVSLFFFISIFWTWKRFQIDSSKVMQEIDVWDEEIKRDIPTFLKTRKLRLITSLGMATALLIIKWIVPREIFAYVFIIGLFHTSLVASLILFKVTRTISWVLHENYLATVETE
jgi:hypothetical protein